MFGLQVNVGTVPNPDWRWVHGSDMQIMSFNTQLEAEAEKAKWPSIKAAIFRVREIDDN
ncbi:MAG TPA: hypothetical protein PL000_11890 [Anaerolineales bacterium]|jgi:hypothetical protein|nr:hypothetical protein [Anaerolineales bacterium]